VLKQKGVKQMGAKQGLPVYQFCYYSKTLLIHTLLNQLRLIQTGLLEEESFILKPTVVE
jgi:hypothetical protein